MTGPTLTKETEHAGAATAVTSTVRARLQQFLAFGGLIVIFAFFSIVGDNFFNYGNITNILFSTVVIGLLALGTTFVIITGGIDLSIGTGMALCAVMSGVFIVNAGVPLPLGVLGAILFGGLIGLVNGLSVAVLKLPPFIATLAMMLVAQGLALVVSHSAPIYFSDSPAYIELSIGSIIPGANFPNAVLVLAVAAVIAGVVLNRTVLGRYTYSIGSNEEATALSGIDVRRWKIVIYTVAGLFTGLAGVMISARLGSAQPATGMGYELQAIAAVVIGGTLLTGGSGSMMGTLAGVLLLNVINNVINQVGTLSSYFQQVVSGVFLIVVVLIQRYLSREQRL